MKLLLSLSIVATILLALPASHVVWAHDESVCSLRITEIRPNPFDRDTGTAAQAPEGEWFEVTNFDVFRSCDIVGGTSGGSNSAWRFTEVSSSGKVARHLLPNENATVTLVPGETVIFAAHPQRFIDTWFPTGGECVVRNILDNPRLNNDKEEVIVRDSPNDGDDDINKLGYDFKAVGGVPEDRSVVLLDVDGDGNGDPVLSLPTPCFPVACVPLFGLLSADNDPSDEAECNIVPVS